MSKIILRWLGLSGGLALIVAILVLAAGWYFGWRSLMQFSNALFLMGGLMAGFGVYSVMGSFFAAGIGMAQSPGYISSTERAQQWVADVDSGHRTSLLLVLAGCFLIAFSALAMLLG